MRTLLLLAALATGSMLAHAPALAAQQRDTLARDTLRGDSTRAGQELPREVVQRIVDRYNAPGTLRANGSLGIPQDQVVSGDVAVLDGTLTVRGRITGSVVVVNGDAQLEPDSRIDGDLLVVGGAVTGARTGSVGGTVEHYDAPLAFHMEGERMVADREASEVEARVRRLVRRYERSSSRLRLTTEGAYNRVEGLPVLLGPALRLRTPWGRVRVDALGIMRSADHFEWDADNIGHDLSGEVQYGRVAGVALGARAYDIVEPVEQWQLRDNEAGLASFLLHRDYRDYYGRHGIGGYLRAFRGPADLSVGYAEERWGARAVRDPFSLFRDDQPWRDNPVVDEGKVRLFTGRLTIDTRNDERDPWTGWLISADVERGSSGAMRLGPTSPGVRAPAAEGVITSQILPGEGPPPLVPVTYWRGFVDLRRYNRISAEGQLNLRLVMGGWLGGDPLPLQRRFSLAGPGALAGYDFLEHSLDPDVLSCNTVSPAEAAAGGIVPAGYPAQCERMVLAQAEYRGDLQISIGGGESEEEPPRHHWWDRFDYYRRAQWVVFVDAGRGWLVHGSDAPGIELGKGSFPSLRSFRTDVGVGLDLSVIGIFVAKTVSDSEEPANIVVRLRHRF